MRILGIIDVRIEAVVLAFDDFIDERIGINAVLVRHTRTLLDVCWIYVAWHDLLLITDGQEEILGAKHTHSSCCCGTVVE